MTYIVQFVVVVLVIHQRSMSFLRPAVLRALSVSTRIDSRTMSSSAPLLLSPEQVRALVDKPDLPPVSLVDSSWFMPNSPRNAKQEFLAKRIPGSQFLDLDEVANAHELGLKHMMPDKETFARACGTYAHL